MSVSRTHAVEVEGVGRFVFHKRRIADQVRIEADAQRMTGGPIDDVDLQNVAIAAATLKALAVEAPEGWDVDALDPLDRADTEKLWGVYRALREAEGRFRRQD